MEALTNGKALIAGDPIYKVPEVAKYLGLAPSNLYAKCKRREFPHIRIGEGAIRIRHSQLEAFLKENTHGPS